MGHGRDVMGHGRDAALHPLRRGRPPPGLQPWAVLCSCAFGIWQCPEDVGTCSVFHSSSMAVLLEQCCSCEQSNVLLTTGTLLTLSCSPHSITSP